MSKRKQRPVARPGTNELPPVETLTIGWMLAVMTTLVCELGVVAARGYLLAIDATARRMEVLAMVLLFAAFVVGSVSLFLGYAVVRARRTLPPRGILIFAAVVGAAPLVTMLIRFLVAGLAPTA